MMSFIRSKNKQMTTILFFPGFVSFFPFFLDRGVMHPRPLGGCGAKRIVYPKVAACADHRRWAMFNKNWAVVIAVFIILGITWITTNRQRLPNNNLGDHSSSRLADGLAPDLSPQALPSAITSSKPARKAPLVGSQLGQGQVNPGIAIPRQKDSAASNEAAPIPSQRPAGDLLIEFGEQYYAKLMQARDEESSIRSEIRRLEKDIEAAKEESASIQLNKPLLGNTWKQLEIGEFESQQEYKKRVDAEKAQEERKFKQSLEEWEAKCQRAELALKKICKTTENRHIGLVRELESAKKKADSVAWQSARHAFLSRKVTGNDISLPRFNRDSLSFEPVIIKPIGTMDLQSSKSKSLMARVEENQLPRLRISLPSLEKAKAFREGFEAGDFICIISIGVELFKAESPIVLQREVVKEEEKWLTKENGEKVAGALIIGLIAQAMGATPEQMQQAGDAIADNPNFQIKPSKERKIIQPEIKVEGTRFHFGLSTNHVTFVDKNMKRVIEAQVTFLDNFLEVDEVMSDAQEGARVLRPGDRIVAVDGKPVHDLRSLRNAVLMCPLNKDYTVTYHRSTSTMDLSFTARAGQYLGIKVKQ